MPQRPAACLGDEIKGVIRERFNNPTVLKLLEEIPSCVRPDAIELAGKNGKVKRAPSEYNLFVKKCMEAKNVHGFKEAAPAMRLCAAEYRKVKEKGGK